LHELLKPSWARVEVAVVDIIHEIIKIVHLMALEIKFQVMLDLGIESFIVLLIMSSVGCDYLVFT
jgi:hypothetical protein